MSSDADAAAETVAIFDSIYLEDYCVIAAAGLFIYDTGFLTFDREVARFWNTKRTGASLLFFANKWITITYYVLLLGTFAIFPSDKSCAVFSVVEFAVAILQYVPGAAFSALRAFVLSRSKLLGLLVFLLSLAPVAANLVHYGYNFSGGNLVPFGCLISDTTTPTLNMRSQSYPEYRSSFPTFILICITWTKLSGWNALRNTTGHSRILSLSDILFRGGIIYFAIMFGLNVLHLALSLASAVSHTGMAYVAPQSFSYSQTSP
ncbi:hypothetical protein C8T65DRAFT_664618 [Cerioporus squamosus]|nr:hypothetical protein C8T65DRAFT_664618 [Cerioporus squamosus]